MENRMNPSNRMSVEIHHLMDWTLQPGMGCNVCVCIFHRYDKLIVTKLE